jgi:small basic protein
MKSLKTILHEIFGLFVDDASFAVAILLWLILIKFLAPHLGVHSRLAAILIFTGLALILAESTTRYAKARSLKSN